MYSYVYYQNPPSPELSRLYKENEGNRARQLSRCLSADTESGDAEQQEPSSIVFLLEAFRRLTYRPSLLQLSGRPCGHITT